MFVNFLNFRHIQGFEMKCDMSLFSLFSIVGIASSSKMSNHQLTLKLSELDFAILCVEFQQMRKPFKI